MEIYTVGGAVRDECLGIPVKDRDYVVVGATPEQLIARGYRPVGRDFPVFLHPQTQEEYALARTERKTARGYHGFQFDYAPDVTLEQDLARRDLTINAMARALDAHGLPTGPIIDPFNGRADLEKRILRHVSHAFVEDPVRILRLARFAARLTDFVVADETLALMRGMVANGEIDSLVAERVWQEIARGLMEKKPSRMFDLLRQCGALARLLPEIDQLYGVPQQAQHHPEIDTGIHVMSALDHAAAHGYALTVRFAVLMHDLGKGVTPAEIRPAHPEHEAHGVPLVRQLCDRLKVPNECRALAVLVTREHGYLHQALELDADALVRLFERCDAMRKPARFAEALQACEADFCGRLGFETKPYPQAEYVRRTLNAARRVNAAEIAAAHPNAPADIKTAVHQARVAAVQTLRASAAPNSV